MRAGVHQVVTFARDPRRGNPAFALEVAVFPDAEPLIAACALLRTEVIAVVERPGDPAPGLRFYTPHGPHAGAGHAALAAAHLALGQRAAVEFRLDGGVRMAARRQDGRVTVDWPVMAYASFDRLVELGRAMGPRPVEALRAPFGYVAVYRSEAEVAGLQPDQARVAEFDRALIATAPGDAADIVVRVFAPNAGLPEDPVCGTAHRIIVPFWAERLGRAAIHSRQLSPRGGNLYCTLAGDTVAIAGETITTLSGTLRIAAVGSKGQQ